MRSLRTAGAVIAATALAGCARTMVIEGPPRGPGPAASVHVLGVPPGHLPRPGMCRVWIPGMPPGRQPRARSCAGIAATAPAGTWILYRPSREPGVVHVHVVDEVRAGVVVMIRYFDVESGRYLREESPDQHHDEDEDQGGERGRGRGRRP